MDFGRQPQSVKVTLEGELIDVTYWLRKFKRLAESSGDFVQLHNANTFKIYPHAVND